MPDESKAVVPVESTRDMLPAIPDGVQIARLDDDELSQVKSFQDALDIGGNDDWDDYGSGFVVQDNKGILEGVPFKILEWRFNHSTEFDGVFASLAIVTESGDKWIVNDGSTGICRQLIGVTNRRIIDGREPSTAMQGLLVRRGLRVSRYETEVNGKMIKAETYYLG